MSPKVKLEASFDGTGASWVELTNSAGTVGAVDYLLLARGIDINRGREDEAGDPASAGSWGFSLDNSDGRFSPGFPAGPYYPYLEKPGVLLRLWVWADGAWRRRAYGTAQSWVSDTVEDATGKRVVCTVSVTDVLGAFPQYNLWQASEQAVRGAATPPTYYWPRLDVDGTASSKFGVCDLVDNGVAADAGTMKLPLDEGDPHPLFTCSSGKRKLTATIPQMFDGYHWRVSLAIDKPSAACNILEITDTFGPHYLSWDGTKLQYYGAGFDVTPGTSASFWPAVVSVRVWYSGGFEYTELRVIGSNGVPYSTSSSFSGYGLKKVVVCPTLSGGATFSAGHLIVDYNETTSWAPVLLAPRIPASVTAAAQLSAYAGGPSITGGTVGASILPRMADRSASEALNALAVGMGARINDNLDGTLAWVEFPPSGTPIAVPKTTRALSWGSSNAGWMSDCTTARDGLTYTATRSDGKRQTGPDLEGVHATWSKDKSYADWLVNTAAQGGRCPLVPVNMMSLTEAQRAALCAAGMGSRLVPVTPAYIPPGLVLICEGLSEHLDALAWTIDFKTSPDVYSRLFILDDPVQGVLDAGYLLAP